MDQVKYCITKRIGIIAFSITLAILAITWIALTSTSTNNSGKTTTGKVNPTTQHSPVAGKCEINPLGTLRTPLLIYTLNNSIAYPQSASETIKLSSDDQIEFACPSGNVVVNGSAFNSTVKAVCKYDDYFDINGITVQWKTVTCSKAITPSVQEPTIADIPDDDLNKICNDSETNSLQLGVIGFNLDSDRFLGIVNICFDTVSKIAVYSNHVIPRSINSRAKNVSTSGYKQDDRFYRMGLSVDQIYKNGQSVINSLLGLEIDSTEYINDNFYINRGHLAPKADFYYAALQTAVQRYINIAPQWNSFNAGNWQQAEKDVRMYATNNDVDLHVWTGTYGNCMLPNKTDRKISLYLYYDETDTKNSPCFPVPEAFWKIVYNSNNHSGIILVGHNNPYYDNEVVKICTDISDSVSWLNWDANNIEKGYSYACDYNDEKFHSLVKLIPKLSVKGLL